MFCNISTKELLYVSILLFSGSAGQTFLTEGTFSNESMP